MCQRDSGFRGSRGSAHRQKQSCVHAQPEPKFHDNYPRPTTHDGRRPLVVNFDGTIGRKISIKKRALNLVGKDGARTGVTMFGGALLTSKWQPYLRKNLARVDC